MPRARTAAACALLAALAVSGCSGGASGNASAVSEGDPEDVGPRVLERYTGLVDRFSVYASYPASPDLWNPLVASFG